MSDEELRRTELRQFLQGRRARIRPEEVGLQSGGRRRVPGLRREEVAALAGVGLTWYTMFETGTARGVSSEVVESIARALRLSDAERAHLQGLAERISGHTEPVTVDPIVREALHRWIHAPAYVIGRAWDVLDWNEEYSRVWDIEKPGNPPFNIVLRYFVDERMRAPLGDSWPAFARRLVAMFRLSWGRNLADDRYAALLEALRTEPEFAALWDSQDVEHPMAEMSVTIDSPNSGRFTYDVLNLSYSDNYQQALIVQVPRP
ncbi:MAG TPA: helix-turn-helix transcriptional regulator [Candidatus Baltobacteraceae bacterium]